MFKVSELVQRGRGSVLHAPPPTKINSENSKFDLARLLRNFQQRRLWASSYRTLYRAEGSFLIYNDFRQVADRLKVGREPLGRTYNMHLLLLLLLLYPVLPHPTASDFMRVRALRGSSLALSISLFQKFDLAELKYTSLPASLLHPAGVAATTRFVSHFNAFTQPFWRRRLSLRSASSSSRSLISRLSDSTRLQLQLELRKPLVNNREKLSSGSGKSDWDWTFTIIIILELQFQFGSINIYDLKD